VHQYMAVVCSLELSIQKWLQVATSGYNSGI